MFTKHISSAAMYLNLIQIAESFGVSEKVVEDWVRKEGLPHTPDRGRLLFGMALDFSEAAAYYGLFTFLSVFVLTKGVVGT